MPNRINTDNKSCPAYFSATDSFSKSSDHYVLLCVTKKPMRWAKVEKEMRFIKGIVNIRLEDGSARHGRVQEFDGKRAVVQGCIKPYQEQSSEEDISGEAITPVDGKETILPTIVDSNEYR
ncbi:hypothetical protein Tco_0725527 [Tanacetum coccineum]|uniref:Uncharacterized protein n=1 Tax=Tanacetum coccineum TaxID=301880 RepID=A0ABQ4YFA9_9ASTR